MQVDRVISSTSTYQVSNDEPEKLSETPRARTTLTRLVVIGKFDLIQATKFNKLSCRHLVSPTKPVHLSCRTLVKLPTRTKF
jgi:hypothetical protein